MLITCDRDYYARLSPEKHIYSRRSGVLSFYAHQLLHGTCCEELFHARFQWSRDALWCRRWAQAHLPPGMIPWPPLATRPAEEMHGVRIVSPARGVYIPASTRFHSTALLAWYLDVYTKSPGV